MALTADVKEELAQLAVTKTTVRAAELATVLRFAGGLHLISGRVAVEIEVDAPAIARRVRKDLAELYGMRSDAAVMWSQFKGASGARKMRVLDRLLHAPRHGDAR